VAKLPQHGGSLAGQLAAEIRGHDLVDFQLREKRPRAGSRLARGSFHVPATWPGKMHKPRLGLHLREIVIRLTLPVGGPGLLHEIAARLPGLPLLLVIYILSLNYVSQTELPPVGHGLGSVV